MIAGRVLSLRLRPHSLRIPCETWQYPVASKGDIIIEWGLDPHMVSPLSRSRVLQGSEALTRSSSSIPDTAPWDILAQSQCSDVSYRS